MGLNPYLRTLLKLIALPLVIIARLIFSQVKRDSDLWVFGAWNGTSFADNTKYLFLHVVNNVDDIKCVWITRSRTVYEELQSLNLPVEYLYSKSGVLSCIRAGKQFTTHSLYDISPVLTKGAMHYCLFHATLPLKEMDFSYLKNSLRKKIAIYINKPFAFEIADFSLCSSPMTSEVVQAALGIDSSQVLETGFPRSCYIDSTAHLNPDLRKIDTICDFSRFDNFIYFVPTFRDDSSFDWFEFGFDLSRLMSLLEETNSVLIFRFHPFELKKVKDQRWLRHDRIIFEDHGLDDPYPLLSKATILVTDYSSIFADFLLLDRPIIFANFAHDEYVKNERALYWEYDDVTPGVKVSEWGSLVQALREILIHNIDSYDKDRAQMVQKIYHQPVDRVCDSVTTLVKDRKSLF